MCDIGNIVNAVLGGYMHSIGWLRGMGLQKSHSVYTSRERSFHKLNSTMFSEIE